MAHFVGKVIHYGSTVAGRIGMGMLRPLAMHAVGERDASARHGGHPGDAAALNAMAEQTAGVVARAINNHAEVIRIKAVIDQPPRQPAAAHDAPRRVQQLKAQAQTVAGIWALDKGVAAGPPAWLRHCWQRIRDYQRAPPLGWWEAGRCRPRPPQAGAGG